MNNFIFEKSIMYNQLFKELDQLYRNYAKNSGLSDTMFWILYFIQEHKEAYTQKELCDLWFYSKQTVNSALKNLEGQNLIKLIPSPNNRKKKQIFLTPSGKELASEIIVPLMKAEESALSKMGEKNLDEFLRLTKEHIGLLNIEMQKISNTLSK